ncbi:flagellar hook-basal body protein [Pseudoneobacillus sp. C159]
MNTSLFISSGALQAYQQKIDTSANNIANVNTTGYKRKDQSFSEVLASQLSNQVPVKGEGGRLTPDGLRAGNGVRTGFTQINLEQGQPIQTDNPFDLMIKGTGFFQLGIPSADGETAAGIRYTRDGSFHLSPNPDNPRNYFMVHASGGYLLDQSRNPIQLDSQFEVNIQSNGQIQLRSKNDAGTTYLSRQQVGIVDIENPQLLKNIGDNQFANEEAGNTVRVLESNEIQLSSGFLEGSNVDLMKEMTNLMSTQRGFQLNARAVSYADQMLGIANNILK